MATFLRSYYKTYVIMEVHENHETMWTFLYIDASYGFLTTDPEVRVLFQALPLFLRSSGSETGSTQPREYNWGVNGVICVAKK
jgi:hypothetical protein